MTARLRIERAGPLCTIQDAGRFGMLAQGVSASGPMDQGGYRQAGLLAGAGENAGIEVTTAGLDLVLVDGTLRVGWAGGLFDVALNGVHQSWPGSANLDAGDRLSVTPGVAGNYGYLRFSGRLDLPKVMGSLSTSTRAKLGGIEGRALRSGDGLIVEPDEQASQALGAVGHPDGHLRVTWGIHAENLDPAVREKFVGEPFRVTSAMDRMGVRLQDTGKVFGNTGSLSLVSEPILPGDIQILGDGTPIVLMRDHQPTGGYPRIATVIAADLDRFAQLRPGAVVRFAPIGVVRAQQLSRRT